MESDRLGGPRLYESHPDARHLRARIVLDDGGGCCSPTRGGSARRGARRRRRSTTTSPPASGSSRSSEALTPEELCELAAGRRAPLKSFLLNQRGIAGIGNIYADEALHRARLHPLSPAGSMKPEHCEDLREGIVETLEAGLNGGGASIDDYRDARGERGTMQDEFLVHTREGEPCPRCGADDPQDRGRGPLDLLLPGLPDAAAPAPRRAGGARARGGERAAAPRPRASRSGTGPTPRARRAAPS